MSKIMIVVLLFFSSLYYSKSQEIKSDLELIASEHKKENHYKKRQVHFVTSGAEQFWVKYNPVVLLAGSMLYVYQKAISQHFYATCYYRPSCSEFSRLLINEYGLVKGVAFSADRLMRCNKIAATDFEVHEIDPHTHKIHESLDIYKKLNE